MSPIDVKAATDNRDSLAKTLYSRMFDWLVDKINTSIGQDPNAVSLVGVLDIYGRKPPKLLSAFLPGLAPVTVCSACCGHSTALPASILHRMRHGTGRDVLERTVSRAGHLQ